MEKHKEMQAQIVEEITRFLQRKDAQIDDISAQRESNHTQAKAASELDQTDQDIFKGIRIRSNRQEHFQGHYRKSSQQLLIKGEYRHYKTQNMPKKGENTHRLELDLEIGRDEETKIDREIEEINEEIKRMKIAHKSVLKEIKLAKSSNHSIIEKRIKLENEVRQLTTQNEQK